MPNEIYQRANRIAIISLGIVAVLLAVSAIYKIVVGGWREIVVSKNAIDPDLVIATDQTIRQVWYSGLSANLEVKESRPIQWVDNSTLLVKAVKDPNVPAAGDEQRPGWLYLWTLGEKPRPYGADPGEAAVAFCAARGNVSYQQNATGQTSDGGKTLTRWFGPPGQEREVDPWPAERRGTPINYRDQIEPADCETFVDPAMAGRSFVTDSTRRYYLNFHGDFMAAGRPGFQGRPIILLRADRSSGAELPISHANVSPSSVYFRIFDGAFYVYNGRLIDSDDPKFRNHHKEWRETKCWPIWRVEPETQKTERICIPYGAWVESTRSLGSSFSFLGAVIKLAPTKEGLFFAYNRIGAQNGLYKLEGQTVRRILAGDVHDPVVSPNGCRVAFNNWSIPNDEGFKLRASPSQTIVAIDLCSKSP